MMGHFKTTLMFTAALLVAGPASAQIGGDLPDPNAAETAPASSDTSLPERPVSIQTPSNTSTQQTDRSEERWRRSRKKPGNSDIFEGNPASTGVGGGLGGQNNPFEADPIDQLPAESRRHLLRQRAAMIAGAGEEYKPSDAAETDPALQEQEKEIWEAMVEDMKQRERAAQSGQQQGGQGQQGQQSQDGQQGEQGQRQSGSRSEQRQAQQQQQSQGGGGQSQSQPQGQQQQGQRQPSQGGGGSQGNPNDPFGESGGAGPVGPRGGSSTSVAEILNGIKGGRSRTGSPDGIPGGTGRGQGQAPSGETGSGRGQGQNPFGGLPPIGGQPGGAQGPQVSLPGTGGTGPRTGPLGDNPFGGVPGVNLPTVRVGQPGTGQPSSDDSERDGSQRPALPSVRVPGVLGDPANGSARSPRQDESRRPPVVATAGIPGSGQGGNGDSEGQGNGSGSGSAGSSGGLADGDRDRGFGGISGPGNGGGQGGTEGAGDGDGDGDGNGSADAGDTPPAPPSPATAPVSDPAIGPLERARQSRSEGIARGSSSASGYIRKDR